MSGLLPCHIACLPWLLGARQWNEYEYTWSSSQLCPNTSVAPLQVAILLAVPNLTVSLALAVYVCNLLNL